MKTTGYLALLAEKVASREQELGRSLTLEEQNQLKGESMREAFVAAGREVARLEAQSEEAEGSRGLDPPP